MNGRIYDRLTNPIGRRLGGSGGAVRAMSAPRSVKANGAR
jgi:hypothetical protein